MTNPAFPPSPAHLREEDVGCEESVSSHVVSLNAAATRSDTLILSAESESFHEVTCLA